MSKERSRRLDKLEKIVSPGRIMCALDCQWHHWLIDNGFLPAEDGLPDPTAPRRPACGRDRVVLLSAAEMGV
jgi:hypothetical protein